MDLVLLVHLASTLAMVGLVWFVQVVHYPLFAGVGRERFVAYEADHGTRTSLVVVPLMCAEALTAALLLWSPPAGVSFAVAGVGFALVVVVWASTFLVQVPLHAKLSRGFDDDAHRRLVRTNWVRTAVWSMRGGLVLWMAASVRPPL